MPTLTSSEREPLNLDVLPEYTREPKLSAKLPIELPPARQQTANAPAEHAKPDMLEALWPGVHNDILHTSARRSPGFYLTIGFAAGALVSLVGVWTVSSVSPWLAGLTKPSTAVAQKDKETTEKPAKSLDTIVPVSASYQVQPGDTLAAIALRNYKRISPRLLDEICRANNMKSADVLVLGQTLVLPEYHPQSSSVPASIPSLSQ